MTLKRIMSRNRFSASSGSSLVDLLIDAESAGDFDQGDLEDLVKRSSSKSVADLSLKAAQALSNKSDAQPSPKLWSFLQRLPHVVASRRMAVDSTLHASLRDPGFQAMIARADRERDARNWPLAEGAYWAALQLYPFHPGYLVQYAHSLKEQGNFIDAEVAYRTALALGEYNEDLIQHIEFTAHKRGASLDESVLRAIRASWTDHSDELLHFRRPPTRQDIFDIYSLFLGQENVSSVDVAEHLNRHTTLEGVIEAVFSRRDFVPANRQLLTYVVETDALRP